MAVFDFTQLDPTQGLSALAQSIRQNFGPEAETRRALLELKRRLAGGRLSPAALQILTGENLAGAAATAGMDPFGPVNLGEALGGGRTSSRQVPGAALGPTIPSGLSQPSLQQGPLTPSAEPEGDLGSMLGPPGAGGPEASPAGVTPQMFAEGFPPEVLKDIVSQPSPKEREERVLAQEDIRDRVSQLNLHHMRINRFLELMGRKERLPVYDPEKLAVPFKGGGSQRKLQIRRLRSRVNDYIQAARTAREAMETQFAVGAETIPPVVTPEFLNYLRVFPNTTEDLVKGIFEGEIGEPR